MIYQPESCSHLHYSIKYHFLHQFCNFNLLKNVSKKLHVGQAMDKIDDSPDAQYTSPGLSDTTFFACQLLNKIQPPLLKIGDVLFSRIWQFFKAFSWPVQTMQLLRYTRHTRHTSAAKREKKLCKAVGVRLSQQVCPFSYLFTAPASLGAKSNLASKNALRRENRKRPLQTMFLYSSLPRNIVQTLAQYTPQMKKLTTLTRSSLPYSSVK